MIGLNKAIHIANAVLCFGGACGIDPVALALFGAGLNLLAAAVCRS